jgi:nucleoside-diphosphate kinase
LEQTLVMVKPDGVSRGLIGEVIQRLERQGLSIVGLKLLWLDQKLAERHYEPHKEKPFFPELLEYITSGPVVAIAVSGDSAIARVRRLIGATRDAAPGSIRGDFATSVTRNVVHGSDSAESAARELGLYFQPEELIPLE